MKNSNIVKPTGLKGNDKLNRMRELMGNKPINEGITRSVVELTKQGPDGNIYAIVRENQEYYIKISEAKSNLVTEDFQYMGGLKNKKDKVYSSYAKAIKQLNLKFMSLNEAAGKSGSFNTFKSDVIINEHHGMNPNATLSASKAIGDNDEYVIDKKGDDLKYDNKEGSEADGFGDNVADSTCEKDIEKVKLSENEKVIDSMITGEEVIEENAPVYNVEDIKTKKIVGYHQYGKGFKCAPKGKELGYSDDPESIPNGTRIIRDASPVRESIKKGFSIARAIQEMDEVIDSIATEDDKVNDILESLGETEKAIMMEALNKNVNEIEKKIHKDKKPAFTGDELKKIKSVVGQIDTDEVESEKSEVKKNVNEMEIADDYSERESMAREYQENPKKYISTINSLLNKHVRKKGIPGELGFVPNNPLKGDIALFSSSELLIDVAINGEFGFDVYYTQSVDSQDFDNIYGEPEASYHSPERMDMDTVANNVSFDQALIKVSELLYDDLWQASNVNEIYEGESRSSEDINIGDTVFRFRLKNDVGSSDYVFVIADNKDEALSKVVDLGLSIKELKSYTIHSVKTEEDLEDIRSDIAGSSDNAEPMNDPAEQGYEVYEESEVKKKD